MDDPDAGTGQLEVGAGAVAEKSETELLQGSVRVDIIGIRGEHCLLQLSFLEFLVLSARLRLTERILHSSNEQTGYDSEREHTTGIKGCQSTAEYLLQYLHAFSQEFGLS